MNKLHPVAKKLGYKTNEDFYKDFPTKEDYVKKYPLGGDPTTIARKDIMTIPGATAQTAGNNGAPIVDPYNFAFEAGVTTLTPQQWRMLDPLQKQTIQHQAYSKVGLKQTGANTFTGTQAQANMLAEGGVTPGGALLEAGVTAGLNYVPIVGPLLSQFAGPVFSAIRNKNADTMTPKEGVQRTQNPFGYKYGGRPLVKYAPGGNLKLEQYEVEDNEIVLGNNVSLEGSNTESSVGKIASGASHKNGGVKGNGGNFVISDRLDLDGNKIKPGTDKSLAAMGKPIMKALSNLEKRMKNDPTAKRTHDMMKARVEDLANLNQMFLNTKNTKVMATGGPLSGVSAFAKDAAYNYGINQNLASEYDNPFTYPPAIGPRMQEFVPVINPIKASPFKLNTNSGPVRRQEERGSTTPIGTTSISDALNANPQFPELKTNGITTGKIDPLNNGKTNEDEGLSNLTKTGMGISFGSAALQAGLTLAEYYQNRKKNPNINYMEDVSRRSEGLIDESLRGIETGRRYNVRDIRKTYAPVLGSMTSNSLNVDRAVKANAYSSMNDSITGANVQYDALKAEGIGRKAQVAYQGDMANAEGKFRVNEANQQDLANLFTSLGYNLENASAQALNAVGIAQNAKSEAQAIAMLKRANPNMTLQQAKGIYEIIVR